jgi:hypothetical protein
MIKRLLQRDRPEEAADIREGAWKFGGDIVKQTMEIWGTKVLRGSLSKRWAKMAGHDQYEVGGGGAKFILCGYEEVLLCDWVELLRGYDLAPTVEELLTKVTDVLDSRGIKHRPSLQWGCDFAIRNGLMLRCARSKEQTRAGLSPDAIALYFHTVAKTRSPDLVCVSFLLSFLLHALNIHTYLPSNSG